MPIAPGLTAQEKARRDWYVSPGGNVWQATGAEADLLKYGLGWQGPMTYDQAQAVLATIPGALKNVNRLATNTADTAKNTVTGTLTGVAAIGDFFHRLTEKQTWTRVGEVALGGILLYAGIRALTHGSATAGAGARKAATRPVKKVAKAAATVAAPEIRLAARAGAKKVAPKTTKRVAAHRAHAAKYGAKKPYVAPKPRQSVPRISQTTRTTHVYHHKVKGP